MTIKGGRLCPQHNLVPTKVYDIPVPLQQLFFPLKFIYSEKATKLCEIFPLLLTVRTVVKSNVKISQNFEAFLDYMYFI